MMSTKNSLIQLCRWPILLLSLIPLMAQSTEETTEFSVSDEQLNALDIRLAPLDPSVQLINASYPAKVVLPAKAEQVISSPVTSLIVQLLVSEYQPVKIGEELIRITSPELGQLQLQMLQATTRASLARQSANREQALFKEGIIPRRRAQETEAALRDAETALSQAKSVLYLAGMSTALIGKILKTGIPVESITLNATQQGIISEVLVKPGQRVDASTALLHITQLEMLWLDIQIPTDASRNFKIGTTVKIPNRNVTARIISISPTVSNNNQSVIVRASVEEKADQLRPGELVTAEIPLDTGANGFDVPLSAVARHKDKSYVFVRTAAGFEARSITVVASAGQRARVEGKIAADNKIAVSGVVALKGAWLEEEEQN